MLWFDLARLEDEKKGNRRRSNFQFLLSSAAGSSNLSKTFFCCHFLCSFFSMDSNYNFPKPCLYYIFNICNNNNESVNYINQYFYKWGFLFSMGGIFGCTKIIITISIYIVIQKWGFGELYHYMYYVYPTKLYSPWHYSIVINNFNIIIFFNVYQFLSYINTIQKKKNIIHINYVQIFINKCN